MAGSASVTRDITFFKQTHHMGTSRKIPGGHQDRTSTLLPIQAVALWDMAHKQRGWQQHTLFTSHHTPAADLPASAGPAGSSGVSSAVLGELLELQSHCSCSGAAWRYLRSKAGPVNKKGACTTLTCSKPVLSKSHFTLPFVLGFGQPFPG